MKKFLLSLAIFAVTSLGMSAQNAANQECVGKNCTEKTQCDKDGKNCDKQNNFFESLNLSPEQKAKIEALRKDCQSKCEAFGKEAKEIKEKEANLSKEEVQKLKADLKAKKAEVKNKCREEIKSILTPEQFQKFQENEFSCKGDKACKKGGEKNCKKDGEKACVKSDCNKEKSCSKVNACDKGKACDKKKSCDKDKSCDKKKECSKEKVCKDKKCDKK